MAALYGTYKVFYHVGRLIVVAPALAGRLRRASTRPFVRPSVRLSVNIYPGCLMSATPLTVLYPSNPFETLHVFSSCMKMCMWFESRT